MSRHVHVHVASPPCEQGRFEESRLLLSEALETRRATLGEEHADTLTSNNNLASLLKAMGDVQPAEVMLRNTLATRRRVLGDAHPDTLTSINNLASLYVLERRADDAIELLTEAVKTACHALGGNDPHTMKFASNLHALKQALKVKPTATSIRWKLAVEKMKAEKA